MKIIDRLEHILCVLFDPQFYMRSGTICDEWSDELERMMDERAPCQEGWLSSNIGGLTIATGHWPDNYGRRWFIGDQNRPLPRRSTAIRLRRYLQKYG